MSRDCRTRLYNQSCETEDEFDQHDVTSDDYGTALEYEERRNCRKLAIDLFFSRQVPNYRSRRYEYCIAEM